ncbi:DUF1127 domain-containing protein (plasmid) [Rhizobium sp. NIBRBAC000502774]|nr:DUF1127 domain-containing protein [Rhizobium sp. NIBRBAC000502774]
MFPQGSSSWPKSQLRADWANNWRKYRQTVTELGRMSSREPQDLGINRADIHSVARQSVAR